MIKQNDSELANIEFLDTDNNSIQFPLYFIGLGISKMAISLEQHVQF